MSLGWPRIEAEPMMTNHTRREEPAVETTPPPAHNTHSSADPPLGLRQKQEKEWREDMEGENKVEQEQEVEEEQEVEDEVSQEEEEGEEEDHSVGEYSQGMDTTLQGKQFKSAGNYLFLPIANWTLVTNKQWSGGTVCGIEELLLT
jgi:hypothetical protein